MWECVCGLFDNGVAVLYEGGHPATIVILNAGPAPIRLEIWDKIGQDNGAPIIPMGLWPGSTRSVGGKQVIARIDLDQNKKMGLSAPYTALAWSVR
jgi:hypothetical protein